MNIKSNLAAGIASGVIKMKVIKSEEVEEVEEVDMSDPATWLPGDIIKCVDERNRYFTSNRKYVFRGLTHNGNITYAHVENDDGGDPNGLRVEFFEWHSRPLFRIDKIIYD